LRRQAALEGAFQDGLAQAGGAGEGLLDGFSAASALEIWVSTFSIICLISKAGGRGIENGNNEP
jgi:hypothetical protein